MSRPMYGAGKRRDTQLEAASRSAYGFTHLCFVSDNNAELRFLFDTGAQGEQYSLSF